MLRHAPTGCRLVATALCTAGICVSIALLADHKTRERDTLAEVRSHPGLAVFADAPTPSDSLPREAIASLANSVQPEFSAVDIHTARRVLANTPGWIVPASDGELCMVRVVYPVAPTPGVPFSPSVAYRCSTEPEVEAGRLVETQYLGTTVSRSPHARVVGVAPNGVASVTIVTGDGLQTAVAVTRNAYEAIVDDPVVARFVTFKDGHSHQNAIPLARMPVLSAAPKPNSGGTLSGQ
jgi:hypothetical protein